MKEIEQNLNGKGLRIGIVQSRFNEVVCEGLLAACRAQLVKSGVGENDITLANVPGALEIPLVLQTMAQSKLAIRGASEVARPFRGYNKVDRVTV